MEEEAVEGAEKKKGKEAREETGRKKKEQKQDSRLKTEKGDRGRK